MTFYVRIAEGQTYQLDRVKFTRLFPESMIVLALQDLDADKIDLSHPCITPRIMTLIAYMTAHGSIPEVNSKIYPMESDPLIPASRYLLMDILGVIGNPMYCQFIRNYPEVNLLDDLSEDYLEIMYYAITHGYDQLCMWTVGRVEHDDVDEVLLSLAALYGNEHIFRAIYALGNVDLIKRILLVTDHRDILDPKHVHFLDYIGETRLSLLECAIVGQNLGITQTLLRDEQAVRQPCLHPILECHGMNQGFDMFMLVATVTVYDWVEVFEMLWEMPRPRERMDTRPYYTMDPMFTYQAKKILRFYLSRYKPNVVDMMTIFTTAIKDNHTYDLEMAEILLSYLDLPEEDKKLIRIYNDVYESGTLLDDKAAPYTGQVVDVLNIPALRSHLETVSSLLPHIPYEDIVTIISRSPKVNPYIHV